MKISGAKKVFNKNPRGKKSVLSVKSVVKKIKIKMIKSKIEAEVGWALNDCAEITVVQYLPLFGLQSNICKSHKTFLPGIANTQS